MTLWIDYLWALPILLLMAAITWVASVVKKDVSIVDSIWSLFFVAAVAVYAWQAEALSSRAALVLVLVGIWALRLCIYITARNWGDGEDYRYREIRATYSTACCG